MLHTSRVTNNIWQTTEFSDQVCLHVYIDTTPQQLH